MALALPETFTPFRNGLPNGLPSIARATRFPEIVTTQVVTWNGSEE